MIQLKLFTVKLLLPMLIILH